MPTGIWTTDQIDTRMLYKEFIVGVEQYNEAEWGIISKFVRSTTKEANKIWQRNMEFIYGSQGYLTDMQRPDVLEISIGLESFNLGYGFTKDALEDSTANELKETQGEALRADQRLLAKRFFYRALTPGVSGTSRGFWDAFQLKAPPTHKGNTFTTSHVHYYVTGSATLALADINTLKKTIREHGYAGELYLFINSGMVEKFENLAGWTSAMTPNTVIETVATLGFKAVKKFQEFTIVEDDWVPDGYLFGVEGTIKPVAMREPLNPQAKGLRLFKGPYEEYPLLEAYYQRRFDMEAVHRGAGAVAQVTAGAWADPTFAFNL